MEVLPKVTVYSLRMSTRGEVQQILIPEEENLKRNRLRLLSKIINILQNLMSSMVRVAWPSKEGASAVSFMGNVVNLQNENIF